MFSFSASSLVPVQKNRTSPSLRKFLLTLMCRRCVSRHPCSHYSSQPNAAPRLWNELPPEFRAFSFPPTLTITHHHLPQTQSITSDFSIKLKFLIFQNFHPDSPYRPPSSSRLKRRPLHRLLCLCQPDLYLSWISLWTTLLSRRGAHEYARALHLAL